MNLNELPRGAEKTANMNVFKIGLEDKDIALRIQMMYTEKTERSIMISHRDKSGAKTLIAYNFKKDLNPPKGFREATITSETLASGEYEVSKADIKMALERANLEAKGEIHQLDMLGPDCPIKSNKFIANVIPAGHTSRKGTLTLCEAANQFDWPRNLQVELEFDDGEPGAATGPDALPIQYIYGN